MRLYYALASPSSFVAVAQFRAVAVTSRPLPTSSVAGLERPAVRAEVDLAEEHDPSRHRPEPRGGQTWGIAVPEITCEQLWQRLQAGEDLVLVDALPTIAFAGAHLPGAINITPERVDSLAERRIPDRDAAVVVYCANPECESSREVAARLLELGYTQVAHFAGGKQAWRDAGLPLEGGRV